jgi:hypothetical protein
VTTIHDVAKEMIWAHLTLVHVFHAYASTYFVIKSEVLDVHVDIFLESHYATFFENIFPMKNSYGMSSLPANVIADTTPEPSKIFDHAEHT